MSTFLELGLNREIIDALTDLNYENPTVIQQKSIPQIISSTNDLKAFAQTGTGKTAAFSLPIIQLADQNGKSTQAIILSPTRELAVQIGNNIKDFSKYIPSLKVVTVYGGANIEEQIRHLKRGVQIVVGTPGRTLDLINRKALKLDNIKWLVLDEADEMLNMGFKQELDKILETTPESKQTLLFSATFPREVEAIAKNYMTKPIEISSGQKNKGADNVSHQYYLVSEKTRYPALKRIADANTDIYAIIFCRTRRETQQVADKLIKDGYNSDALHGDLSQAQRDSVMEKFRKKNIQMLVATDVAARGLDVDNLTHVINHKMPDQIENYTHRSGRTGRAGKKGISIALVTKKEQVKIRPIERIIKKKFEHALVPSAKEICENQLFYLIDKVHNTEVNTSQIETFLPAIYQKLENLTREELIQKFVSLEFNSFLSYYQNAEDLNDLSSKNNSKATSENMIRFFINVGRKDRLNPEKLIRLINEQVSENKVDIGDIDILDTFSFFEIDKDYQTEILLAFKENKPYFNGRLTNIEITKKGRSSQGRQGRKSFKSKNKSGFGNFGSERFSNKKKSFNSKKARPQNKSSRRSKR